jgi:hypothetical protein
MTQWQQRRTWLIGLVLLAMVGALVSCGEPGGEGCGGIEDVVSCVSITGITPTNIAGENTSDVDAVRDICSVDATTGQPELEPFGAHNATITFSNAAFPGSSRSQAVTLQQVSVSYSLNTCPDGAVCPPLPGFSQSVPTLVIPEGSTASGTFPFVPLSVKDEYVNQGGDTTRFPSYNADYVFTGQTQFFSDTITIRGSAAFTIGNFDLCE